MVLHTPLCPECRQPATGTVERLMGCADFDRVPGLGVAVEYSGWTEIWWNEQRTALEHDGKPKGPGNRTLVCCRNGHTWPTATDK